MRCRTFSLVTLPFLAVIVVLCLGTAVMAQRPKGDVRDPFAPPEAAANSQPQLGPPTAAPQGAARPQARMKALSAVQRIEQELEQATELDVVEMPLKDVVHYLSEKHSIPIVLKAKKLEEASVSPDTPVTKSLRGIRLSSALNLMLEDLELAYLVKDEVLQITTLLDARATTEVRIYDCRDILAMPAQWREKGPPAAGAAAAPAIAGAGGYGMGVGGGGMGAVSAHDERAQRLMMIIMTSVDPQTWQAAAGGMTVGYGSADGQAIAASQGGRSISEYNGLLVVTQTAQSHRKVEHVLNMLREAAGLEGKLGKVVR